MRPNAACSRGAFSDPKRLKPRQTTAALTEAAAARFGDLAQGLRARGKPNAGGD